MVTGAPRGMSSVGCGIRIAEKFSLSMMRLVDDEVVMLLLSVKRGASKTPGRVARRAARFVVDPGGDVIDILAWRPRTLSASGSAPPEGWRRSPAARRGRRGY